MWCAVLRSGMTRFDMSVKIQCAKDSYPELKITNGCGKNRVAPAPSPVKGPHSRGRLCHTSLESKKNRSRRGRMLPVLHVPSVFTCTRCRSEHNLKSNFREWNDTRTLSATESPWIGRMFR